MYIDELLKEEIDYNEVLTLFFLDNFNYEYRKYTDNEREKSTNRLINILEDVSTENIIKLIDSNKDKIKDINPGNIPQFSNLSSINDVLDFVSVAENTTYELIGYYINKDSKKGAQMKYGENHYKIAALIGLVTPQKPFEVTDLGKRYMMLTEEEKLAVRNKLFLQIPIVQILLTSAISDRVNGMDVLRKYLSESTSIRRRSNLKNIINCICENIEDTELNVRIMTNIEWK